VSPMAHWQNEHANTPGDRLLALELARQNAKWPFLILDRMTDVGANSSSGTDLARWR